MTVAAWRFSSNHKHHIVVARAHFPCKTYAEGTPCPKLSYARYFQGKRATKNMGIDDSKELPVLAQILSLSIKEMHVSSKETAKRSRMTSHSR